MSYTEDDIAGWKAQYGDIFAMGEYIFRALKVGEHKELIHHKEWTNVDFEDYLVKTTLLDPTFEELEAKAGLISSLAEEVLHLSGYGKVAFAKKVMNDSREKAQQVTNLMKVFIIAAMPSYNDDDLDQFTFAQLADKVALSEQIIEVRSGGRVLELVDPEEEAAKEAEKQAKEATKRVRTGQANLSSDPIAQRLQNALG